MTLLKAHRMFGIQGGTGDVVLAGMWIPAKSTIRRIQGYCVYEGTTILSPLDVHAGSMAGYILPMRDPDSVGTMNVEWERLVPKDSAQESLDLDTSGSDSSTFWEPGEQRWQEVFEVGSMPVKLYEQHFLAGIGHNSIIANRDPETPFAYEFLAGTRLSVNLNGPIHVDQPSLLVFASGSPDLDATSITQAQQAITENEWGQLQFIDHVMERAHLHLIGLVETGAETPWEEATALLKRHLDPLVFEPLANTFVQIGWLTYGEFEFDVEVEGTMGKSTIEL